MLSQDEIIGSVIGKNCASDDCSKSGDSAEDLCQQSAMLMLMMHLTWP